MYHLTPLDWTWIIACLAVSFGVGAYHTRSASRSLQDYFVAGRTAPWWILGTSMVATSFSVDTPLAVAHIVIKDGIAGNWMWWAVLPSGMLGVFFFAHLWQRSGCLTQAELATLRYGRGRAHALRIFNVVFYGLLQNCVTLGWVNLAMVKVFECCTSLEKGHAVAICFGLTVVYTLLGGVSGVMWTDFVQFALMMGASVAVAGWCVHSAGGLDTLVQAVQTRLAAAPAGSADVLSCVPAWGTTAAWAFAIYTTLFWIACTPTDCNGYAVQRLLCARDERHAVWGYLWFNVAHYVLRPWPWILVGLVAIAAFDYGPGGGAAGDPEKAYLEVMLQRCPSWLIGPALASLLASYMSTINTHLNWGASFVINDLYVPYLNRGRSTTHYVWASRAATVVVALGGVTATLYMDRITSGWELFFSLASGMGLVRIARWLWWRVTAWTEIGCMAATAGCTWAVDHFGSQIAVLAPFVDYPFNLLIVVPASVVGALIGTYAVHPEPQDVLRHFAQRVQPPGPGWRRVRGRTTATSGSALLRPAVCWVLSTTAMFAAMFGVGELLLGTTSQGLALCAGAAVLAVATGLIYRGAGAAASPAGLSAELSTEC